MSFAELLLLGVALSMDAFAVSMTNGMMLGRVPVSYALAIALTFGAFQALMPLIGFSAAVFFMHISKPSTIGSYSCCSARSEVR